MTTPELLSTEEAAAMLRLHPKRVQRLAREGKLPAVRHGRRWLFRRDLLLRGAAPANTKRGGDEGGGIDLSARNQLRGTVRSVTGEGTLVEVALWMEAQELIAVITRTSAERLGLVRGAPALGVIKSTEVMVARQHEPS